MFVSSSIMYIGRFLTSKYVLAKYSPKIPLTIICTPNNNNTSKIIIKVDETNTLVNLQQNLSINTIIIVTTENISIILPIIKGNSKGLTV